MDSLVRLIRKLAEMRIETGAWGCPLSGEGGPGSGAPPTCLPGLDGALIQEISRLRFVVPPDLDFRRADAEQVLENPSLDEVPDPGGRKERLHHGKDDGISRFQDGDVLHVLRQGLRGELLHQRDPAIGTDVDPLDVLRFAFRTNHRFPMYPNSPPVPVPGGTTRNHPFADSLDSVS